MSTGTLGSGTDNSIYWNMRTNLWIATTRPDQLARGSVESEGLHVRSWNTAPCLITSSELIAGNGIVFNALQSTSTDGRSSKMSTNGICPISAKSHDLFQP